MNSEANGERAAKVPVHQEGEEKLVPDRPHRQIQKVEVAAQRGIRNGERKFGLVSLSFLFHGVFMIESQMFMHHLTFSSNRKHLTFREFYLSYVISWKQILACHDYTGGNVKPLLCYFILYNLKILFHDGGV